MKRNNEICKEIDADTIIARALVCLEEKMIYKSGEILNKSTYVANYVRLQLAQEKNEVFAAMFLDNRHGLIKFEKMFFGTINESVVYPRVIVQKALRYNAAALIVAHNHPSGNLTPSSADKEITDQLKKVLEIVDIRFVDHVIVSHQDTYSFAEHGLL